MVWTDLILVAVLVVGVLIAQRSRIGRPVLSRPRCAGCRYELTGLEIDDTHPRCPECGADVTAPDAVLFGRMRPRRWGFRIGVLLVLVPVLMIGGRTVQRYSGLQWSQFRPATWVVRDLGRPEKAQAAWLELERRYEAGQLGGDAVAAITEIMLADLEQGVPPTRPVWRRGLLETFLLEGRFTKSQTERLVVATLENGLDPKLRTKARRDGWLAFRIGENRSSSRLFGRLLYLRAVRDEAGNELQLKDHFGRPLRDDVDAENPSAGGTFALSSQALVRLPVGTHELTFELDVGAFGGTRARPRPGPPEDWPETLHRWKTARTVRVEVVDLEPGEFIVEGVRDPSLADEIRNLVKIKGWRRARTVGRNRQLRLELELGGLPDMALAFDVFMRVDDREVKIGSCTSKQGGRSRGTSGLTRTSPQMPEDFSDVLIFRANPGLVEDDPGVDRVWVGELIFDGVKVINPPRAD